MLAFEYFFHFNYVRVRYHFDDLYFGLNEGDLLGVELAFVNVLHGNNLLRVFVLALVNSRVLS